jgi:hypothetical protein
MFWGLGAPYTIAVDSTCSLVCCRFVFWLAGADTAALAHVWTRMFNRPSDVRDWCMEVKCHQIQEFASSHKLLGNLGMDMRLMVHLKPRVLPLVSSQMRCSEQHLESSPIRMSNRLSRLLHVSAIGLRRSSRSGPVGQRSSQPAFLWRVVFLLKPLKTFFA